jgi:hypothetical protein
VHVTYIRDIHRHNTTLSILEIRMGVCVPELHDYIVVTGFLIQIAENFSGKGHERVDGRAVKENAKILGLSKQRYVLYELLSGIIPETYWMSGLKLWFKLGPSSPAPSEALSCVMSSWHC